MVEEGYRRILAATESEDLAVAVASLHGNARRRLAPSLEALIGRALEERVTKLAGKVSASLTRLATDANRHDAMTVDDATPEQAGPLPAGISGHSHDIRTTQTRHIAKPAPCSTPARRPHDPLPVQFKTR